MLVRYYIQIDSIIITSTQQHSTSIIPTHDIPQLLEPLAEENYSYNAQNWNDWEGNGQKVIFAANEAQSSQIKVSISIPLFRVVIVFYLHFIISRLQVDFYLSPRLLKIRKSWSPHPNNEMLILWIDPLFGRTIRRSSKFSSFVSIPCYSLLINWNFIGSLVKFKCVIKKSESFINE